jgi:hypothetical protein
MPLPLLALGLAGMGLKNLNDKVNEDRSDGRQRRADQQAQRAAVADVDPVIKEASDGMGPSAVMVGKQAYGTEADASVAAKSFNAPDAKIARLQGVMLNQANPAGAMDLEKNSIDMAAYRRRAAAAIESEGINHFVDANLGAAPSVSDIESGKVSTFDLSGVEDFNKKGGKLTVPEGSKGQWKVLAFDNGRKVADFQVVGPDGKPLTPISARTLQSIHAQSLSEREKTADAQFKEGAEIKLKRDELDSRNKYWEGMVNAATTRADKTGTGGKGASLFDRMDEADKIRLQGLQARAVRIETAMSTAQANGTWDPNSAGAKQLLEQQADVETMVDKIFSSYSTKGASTGDSLGLFKDGDKSGAQQSASGSGNGSDRFKILNAELQQALSKRDGLAAGSAERIRLDEDISALGRELRALPQSERGASAGKSSGSAVKSAQSEGAAKQSAPAGGTQEPQTKLSALKQAQGAANAYRPPLDLRAQVSEAGKSSKRLSAEDLSVLNIINGRK